MVDYPTTLLREKVFKDEQRDYALLSNNAHFLFLLIVVCASSIEPSIILRAYLYYYY